MPLWLAQDVHAVALDADIVVLDAASDAYLCLVGASALISLGSERSVSADPAAAETLREAGLVAPHPSGASRPIPPKPTIDLPDATREAQGRELRAAAWAGAATAIDFRRRSFRQLLARAGQRPPGQTAASADEVLAAAAVFMRLRPWSPVGGACLMRSYYLLRHLRILGFDADWIIGVRTWPFMAHCWLQVGAVALDDDVERLTAYTPILAV